MRTETQHVAVMKTSNNATSTWVNETDDSKTEKPTQPPRMQRHTQPRRIHRRSRQHSIALPVPCGDEEEEVLYYRNPFITNSSSSMERHHDAEDAKFQLLQPPHILSTNQGSNGNSNTSTTLYKCHSSNAIVYMVQKGKHSSYERNSTALLFKSLDLLYQNYLGIDQHYANVDVLLFHTGDYTPEDLTLLQERYHQHVFFRLINLQDTLYWSLPHVVRQDDFSKWSHYPDYGIGYRHMMRWYALKLYDFMRDWNEQAHDGGCSYRYVMRMDEESFIHSPIAYDLFQFMERFNYSYAYRMCSYELDLAAWNDYQAHVQRCGATHRNSSTTTNHNSITTPFRQLAYRLCGFYNNFFLLDLHFVEQRNVQHFLRWVDRTGIIYRRRYNDLQIQTIAVYAFCPPERIHRFLDWSYEHMTVHQASDKTNGSTTVTTCPLWGAIQAGYLDLDMNGTISRFEEESNMHLKSCQETEQVQVNQFIGAADLSPTFAHFHKDWTIRVPSSAVSSNMSFIEQSASQPNQWLALRTISAGPVELPDRGIMSG